MKRIRTIGLLSLVICSFADLSAMEPAPQGREVHHAAESGDIARLEQILKESPQEANARPEDLVRPPLHWAAAAGQRQAVKVLIEHGASINAGVGSYHGTALHAAARAGQEQVAEVLLANGAEVSATNHMGETPLHWTAYAPLGAYKTVEMSDLPAGVLPASRPDALRIVRGQQGVVTVLLTNGAAIEAKSRGGYTPLNRAGINGHWEIMKTLVEAGADPSSETEDGWTPLCGAAAGGEELVVNLLLSKGVDVNARTPDRQTRLHLVAEYGPTAANGVVILLKHGAAINAIDTNGRTPLHWAVIRFNDSYNLPVIKALVENGADVKVRDSSGRTALDYAVAQGGKEEIVDFLKKAPPPRIPQRGRQ